MGRSMKQGEIYCHTFRPPDKRRPVLILTRNSVIPYLSSVTVAPLTTRIRDISSQVTLTPDEDGVSEESAVSMDNIQTIQKADIGQFITTLSSDKMRDVRDTIEFALGLDTLQ